MHLTGCPACRGCLDARTQNRQLLRGQPGTATRARRPCPACSAALSVDTSLCSCSETASGLVLGPSCLHPFLHLTLTHSAGLPFKAPFSTLTPSGSNPAARHTLITPLFFDRTHAKISPIPHLNNSSRKVLAAV